MIKAASTDIMRAAAYLVVFHEDEVPGWETRLIHYDQLKQKSAGCQFVEFNSDGIFAGIFSILIILAFAIPSGLKTEADIQVPNEALFYFLGTLCLCLIFWIKLLKKRSKESFIKAFRAVSSHEANECKEKHG